MSLPDRLAGVVTDHARIVIVALLLTTALVGAGMPMVDDDSSLDQFESDSPEGEALADIDERFSAEGDENTTSVQLINRDDEPLSQESLLASLEFQRTIHDNESVNATLAEENPITGVENLVAITAITDDQAEDIEDREQALENRTDILEEGLDEVLELQREYEALSDEGEDEAAADVEDQINATVEETAAEADLDDEQTEDYEEMVDNARGIESQRWMLENLEGEPVESDQYQELTDALDDVYTGATMGVFEETYQDIASDAGELEEDGAELEQRTAALEAGFNETLDLQRDYEEAVAAGDDEEAAAIEDEIDATVAEAASEADLDDEQSAQYNAMIEQARETESERWQIEQMPDDPEQLPEYQELTDALEEIEDSVTDDALEAGLEDALALQREYEQLNVTGQDEEAAAVEDEINATVEEAAIEAGLDDQETAEYVATVDEARSIDAERWALEDMTNGPEDSLIYQAATAGIEELRTGATLGVFQEEYERLEEAGESLEQRQERLEEREDILEEGLDEVLELQREYEELDDQGDNESAAAVEDEINATVEEAATDANLDDDETDTYEEMVDNARGIESQRWMLENLEDDPVESEDYEELTDALDDVYDGATLGVFQDEYERLEEDAEELEEIFEEQPSLDEQIEALEGLDDDEFEDVLTETLSEDDGEDAPALGFMPSDYEPGSTDADARMTMVSQASDGGGMGMEGGDGGPAMDAQLDLRELATQSDQEYLVFGPGIIFDEIDRSLGDSFAIVGPLALLFVVVALSIAYRDPLDIVLGVVGILAVLVWTFGFMGWADIAFNQMMIAVPVLLIGLSIDYAIHVFMRHREQRETAGVTDTVRGSMAVALAGVGVALVWVTATAAIGFLANLTSPIAPIQEFGVTSSVGVVSALIIFGALIPALKVEVDSFLESRGWDRRKRAFGTGEGRFTSVLAVGSTAARKAPLVILLVALLLTAGGVYGASQVDTSFNEEDFLAESPPAWTEHLPGPMAPGEYQAADDLDFVNENFQREDAQAQILVEGDITDDDTLQRLSDAQDEAAESDTVYTLANGEADVESPLSVMEDTAAGNESFNESFHAADTDGDGVPDRNLESLYDELFEVDEDAAASMLHRTDDGAYDSTRLIVSTQGDAGFDEVTDEMRAIAGTIDASGTGDERNLDAGDGELNAIATGSPIVNHIVEQDLLDTVLESLLITLVAVFAFLTAAYWLTGNSATLGAVTLLPVAFSVSWILGTMYLLGMPFNVLTGMITSLTVGLGVAYSIHVSARYTLELERQGNVWSAMYTTVTGTGGALLGSAATTVGGFGTLAFAIFPVLQQFGIITGLTITYAFLASVVVLPTMLVLWTRYFGPDVSFDVSGSPGRTPAASDGGTEATPADAGGDDE